jgi:ribose-phosphate pyrophosphokinase
MSSAMWKASTALLSMTWWIPPARCVWRPRRLKDWGAASVRAYCTHAVLSGPAVDNIRDSALDELVVTDTIPLRPEAAACPNIRQISVAGLLAESMRRIHFEESVSSLFL